MNIYEQANKAYFDELKSLVDTSSKWALQVNAKGKKRLLERGHKPKYAHLKVWIDKVTPLLADPFYTVMTKVYWIINGIRDWDDPRVRCSNCGRPFKDKNVINTYVGYFTYCSVKCQSNSDDIKNKIAATNFDRYGGHHSVLKSVQEKSKKTRLDKYGNETYNNTEKVIETRKERFDGNYAPLDFAEKCRKTKVANGHPENWTNREQAVETRLAANNGKYESPETDLKRRRTCMERFGVEYSFQSDEVKEKSKQTCLERYGAEHYNQTGEFKEKSKRTCLEKYGVEFPMWLDETKDKARQTCVERYGIEHYSQTDEYLERRKLTWNKNYGTDHPMRSDTCKTHMEKSMLKTYGVEYAMQSDEIREKSRLVCLEKYGVENPMQSEEVQEKFRQTCLSRFGVKHPSQCREIRLKAQARYEYESISFDSSPELVFYIWLKDTGADFEYQPDTCFWYEYGGKKHRYFPDFRVNDIFIEIKGDHFLTESGKWQCPWDHSLDSQYEAKHQCVVTNAVKIMYSAEYQKYLDYVNMKYGADWISQFRRQLTI